MLNKGRVPLMQRNAALLPEAAINTAAHYPWQIQCYGPCLYSTHLVVQADCGLADLSVVLILTPAGNMDMHSALCELETPPVLLSYMEEALCQHKIFFYIWDLESFMLMIDLA